MNLKNHISTKQNFHLAHILWCLLEHGRSPHRYSSWSLGKCWHSPRCTIHYWWKYPCICSQRQSSKRSTLSKSSISSSDRYDEKAVVSSLTVFAWAIKRLFEYERGCVCYCCHEVDGFATILAKRKRDERHHSLPQHFLESIDTDHHHARHPPDMKVNGWKISFKEKNQLMIILIDGIATCCDRARGGLYSRSWM